VVPQDDLCLAEDSCGNSYRCWDHSDSTIALTTTTFSFKTGTIFDADIELNAAPHLAGEAFLFTTVASPPCPEGNQSVSCVSSDVQNTMTHEIGHALGLDHVDVAGSTMEPSAPTGETRKRIIDNGTAAGFCDTYPRGAPAVPCDQLGQVRLRIVAKNTGTAGLEALGCSSATTGGSSVVLALLVAMWRRRGG
jgi:hypothetical protein